MIFSEAGLEGACFIDVTRIADERGFFARMACTDAFAEHGLDGTFVQQSISYNSKAGTLRGLHFQQAPHAEAKLVRVTRGAVFDVLVDLRPGSTTFGKHISVELTADNRRSVYIPKGIAHGFQTLVDDTEVHYEMTERFVSDAASGVRWNDPDLAIGWPEAPDRIISARDQGWPLFSKFAPSRSGQL